MPPCEILTSEVLGQHPSPFQLLPAGANVVFVRVIVVENQVQAVSDAIEVSEIRWRHRDRVSAVDADEVAFDVGVLSHENWQRLSWVAECDGKAVRVSFSQVFSHWPAAWIVTQVERVDFGVGIGKKPNQHAVSSVKASFANGLDEA